MSSCLFERLSEILLDVAVNKPRTRPDDQTSSLDMLNTNTDSNGISGSTRRFLLVIGKLRVGRRERMNDELS